MSGLRDFLGAVFKGPNGCWDFGRLAAFHAVTSYTLAFLYALIWLGRVPTSWTDLGGGYAAVLAASAALIAGKDIAVAKASATQSGESQ